MTTSAYRLTSLAAATVVRGGIALLVLAAFPGGAAAQDPEPQTLPVSTIDAGLGPVRQGSYKAGEYNGLEKQGAFAIANVDLRRHAAYDSPSALRWRIKGVDLGLKSRSLSAQVGVQGKYRIRFGFDELPRYRSDTYQTPYDGAGSSNSLTLPATWLVPNVAGSGGTNPASARGLVKAIGNAPFLSTAAGNLGALVSPTAAQTALVDAAANADMPLFHNVNLQTTRTKIDAGFNYIFDSRWTFDANFRPEHKDGVKPMGTVSRNTGGDISTVIPDRIDTQTNELTASLAFKGKKSFAQGGYYGSFFKNNVGFMSWQNWAALPGTPNANMISSTPDNSFNQFSATAGVNFSPTTRLIATGSYARNTQDVAFITDASTPGLPVRSLNGLVVSTAVSAKFTGKPSKRLHVAAGYRYDDRDNRTPVNIYQFADANQPLPTAPNADFPAGPNNPLGAIIAQNANANRPYSKRLNQVDTEADYAVAARQWIKAGYTFERIAYTCPGSWINCADAPTTNDQTLRVEWRTIGADVTARVGYVRSQRRAPAYDENAFLALVPYANVSPASATGGATALSFMRANNWNGWGPALPFAATTGNMNLFFPSNNALANGMYGNTLNRISELPGMRRYNVADRNRDKVRTLVSWQASDPLSFQAAVDLNKDEYPTSIYGLQNAKSWMLELESTYALGENTSVDVFYTYDDGRSVSAGNTYTANSNPPPSATGQPGVVGLSGNAACDSYTTLQQRNNNNKLDPCLEWSADRLDKAHTFGFGVSEKVGRLNVAGNFIVTRARWDNNMTGGNWANNPLNGLGAPPTTIAAFFIPATPMPTMISDTAEVRLNGRYRIRQGQTLHLAYAYLHMRSDDWIYEGMQFGSLSTQLPTGEQPFKYTVNVFGLSYVLTF